MAEVAVDVSGVMEPPPEALKKGAFGFLQFPTQLPDPQTWVQQKRQNIRSWTQFLQTSNFKIPPSIPRLSRRIMRNIEYFQSNYLFVFLGLAVYCLITSPLLLIALACSFYAGYKLSKRHQEKKFVVFGRELTLAQQYGLITLCAMPVFYFVGAGAAMFWVLGASFFVITLHASFYNIEALVAEEDEFPIMMEEV